MLAIQDGLRQISKRFDQLVSVLAAKRLCQVQHCIHDQSNFTAPEGNVCTKNSVGLRATPKFNRFCDDEIKRAQVVLSTSPT